MKLIGPWPHIATGTIAISGHRTRDGLTLIIRDQANTGLDEISVRMIGISTADADAYEQAITAFQNALAMAKAREAA